MPPLGMFPAPFNDNGGRVHCEHRIRSFLARPKFSDGNLLWAGARRPVVTMARVCGPLAANGDHDDPLAWASLSRPECWTGLSRLGEGRPLASPFPLIVGLKLAFEVISRVLSDFLGHFVSLLIYLLIMRMCKTGRRQPTTNPSQLRTCSLEP